MANLLIREKQMMTTLQLHFIVHTLKWISCVPSYSQISSGKLLMLGVSFAQFHNYWIKQYNKSSFLRRKTSGILPFNYKELIISFDPSENVVVRLTCFDCSSLTYYCCSNNETLTKIHLISFPVSSMISPPQKKRIWEHNVYSFFTKYKEFIKQH